jgi:hypothetical protein
VQSQSGRIHDDRSARSDKGAGRSAVKTRGALILGFFLLATWLVVALPRLLEPGLVVKFCSQSGCTRVSGSELALVEGVLTVILLSLTAVSFWYAAREARRLR